MSGASLNGMHGGIRYQIQHIPCLDANILNTQVAGDLVADVSEALLEVRLQFSRLVAQEQIFKGIKKSRFHFLYRLIIRVH